MRQGLTISTSLARSELIEPGQALLRVELSARSSPARPPRRPCHLALVLDRSASMTGAPLGAIIAAAEAVARRLDERDRLTVVIFDADARTLAEVEPMFPAAREALIHRLRGARPGRGTNISAGVRKAMEVQSRVLLKGAIPRLLVLTDGEPSAGAQTGPELLGVVDEVRAAGLTMSCAGVGSHYDAPVLRRMAERGGGSFHDLPSPDAIESFLMRELDGVAMAVASGVEVELAPGNGVEELQLLRSLPSHRSAGHLVVEVGEVCAHSSRSVLLLATAPRQCSFEVGVSYVDEQAVAHHTGPDPVALGAGTPQAQAVASCEWLALRLAELLDRAWNRSVHNKTAAAIEDLDDASRLADRARRKGTAPPVELMQRVALARQLMSSNDRGAREAARRDSEMLSHLTQSGMPPLEPH